MSDLSRRSFFLGAAAAVVVTPTAVQILPTLLEPVLEIGRVPSAASLYAELAEVTRKAFLPRLYEEIYWQNTPVMRFLAAKD